MTSLGRTGEDSRDERALQHPRLQMRRTRRTHDVNVGRGERWGSIIAGAALVTCGFKRRSFSGTALALLGGGLLDRGMTGYCRLYQALGIDTARGSEAPQVIEVAKAITIDESPEELYRFWRHFENLPCFMSHLKSVSSIGGGRSHWVATAPLGRTVEWDAELTEERDNELIAWHSLEGARIPNHGRVRFQGAPGGRGTEVHVTLAYQPPMGRLGSSVAKLFGEEPGQQLEADLRRLKSFMEAGEMPTTQGQPSGRGSTGYEAPARHRQRSFESAPKRAVVEGGSGDSFPAGAVPASRFRSEGR
jgi:uncharacterized membrane protein